eukprot:CAMPEP_0115286180 /NCGR_PEP_ID=MMETSP0270-20121206/61811_1 /TAXON_ID=71861 /ORGANISM="Scrippsiella trochoidea, Strain CCMP3099" /LENGTH=187 /DNA_ID=CAMNT_0002703221 /DNA_START=58 /DNA_END=621 /DNA_ORIENTATION=+
MASASRLPAFCLLSFAALVGLKALGFVAPLAAPPRAANLRAARAAYESGKVNFGAEITADVAAPPTPVTECDESCMTAILDCLEDGCSVEALAKLDQQLADDERKISASVEQLHAAQKTAYSEENVGTLAWLNNFLSRSASLRAQLHTLKGFQDTDFVKQMVKAASMAFGGGRKGDYPRVGVSPYSA